MAKKNYSAEALIERDYQQQLERRPEPQPVAEQPTPTIPAPTASPIPLGGGLRGSQLITSTPEPQSVLPNIEDWDYRTAKTDMQGNTYKKVDFFGINLEPKGFTPNGDAWFGGGITGWLKKYAYELVGDEVTEKEKSDKWDKFWETSTQYSKNFFEIQKTQSAVPSQDSSEVKELKQQQSGLFLQGALQLFDAVKTSVQNIAETDDKKEGYGVSSPITPLLRATTVGLSMLFDAFQFVTELPEKGLAIQEGMREFSENKTILPDIALDDDDISIVIKEGDNFNHNSRLEIGNDFVNTVTRLFVPFLQGYDAIRFFTAEGTLTEKFDVIKTGWIEGRMFYSELVHPTVEEEYKQRALAGEDPYLLAMELEDPWAELIGEVVLDPFNVFGLIGKSKKLATTTLEATQSVEKSGLLTNADFINAVKGIESVATDAQASSKIDELVNVVSSYAKNTNVTQSYKPTALSAAGNQIHYQKVVNNYLNNAIQTIRNTGGTPDDVLDFVSSLIRIGSDDVNLVKKAVTSISRSPLRKIAYNQAGFDTGYILRQALGDGDSLVKALSEAGTDWNKIRDILDTRVTKSLEATFPSVVDMVKATDKVEELAKAGQVADSQTIALAEKLKTVPPNIIKRAKTENLIRRFVSPLNGLLANSYFALSYGYASRNFIQNLFTIAVDGWKVTDGIPKLQKLDDWFINAIGEIPQSLRGKTFIESVTEGSLMDEFFSKLNKQWWSPAALADAAEVYTGKLIYKKYYMSTMETAMDFGVGLPKMDDWKLAGFTESQANDFKQILKAENYNEASAYEKFNTKYGSGTYEKWRTLDFVNSEAKKGLENFEDYWTQIVNLTNNPNTTQREVLDLIDNLKTNIRHKANNTRLDPIRFSDDGSYKDIKDSVEIGKLPKEWVNQDIVLRQAADQAVDELKDKLTQAHKILLQDPTPENIVKANQVMDWVTNAGRGIRPIEEKVAQKLTWLNDIYEKAGKTTDYFSLWDEAILGTRPATLTRKELYDQARKVYYQYKRSLYDGYYSTYLTNARTIASELDMGELFSKADEAIFKLDQYRNMTFTPEGMFMPVPTLKPSTVGTKDNFDNLIQLARTYGISTATESGKANPHLLRIINKYAQGKNFTKLDDVPLDLAEKALADYMGDTVKAFVKKDGDNFIPNEIERKNAKHLVQVPPPHDPNLPPSGARAVKENQQGLLDSLNHVRDGIIENWGLRVPGGSSDVSKITGDLSERLAFTRSKATQVAEKYRDFALLPYGETKNIDFALSLIYPYQFWYTRSYSNWMKRAFMTNPEIISRYANLKDTMAKEHKDLPEWWKYNVPVKLPFMDEPLYLNLEAAVWPLYGLTGTDFNDPVKRTNWFTATIDDMGKFGPSVWSPIQWAVAAYYKNQGEDEIASRWGSRMIPQTATIKSISSYFGNPIELDPNVRMFNGDNFLQGQPADPYEEGRISRALTAMEAEGIYTKEQLMEAALTHEGEIWNEAYRRATQIRAPGQLMSFLFGVGFKARTASDIETDKFYADYSRMKKLHDGGYLSDEQYSQGFNELREKYPFMDIILLSRRAGVGRQEAYAYNVISRIPPGMTNDIYKLIDVDPETAQKFYDSGGKLEGMSETEKQRFLAAMIDAGAILAIPSNSTRREWTTAKNSYKDMQEQLKNMHGEEVLDLINTYFAIDNVQKAREFLELNPEVGEALDMQNQLIMNTPVLMKYYGGIDTLERYYKGEMYDQLEKQFGADIVEVESQYYNILDAGMRKTFLAQNPQLKSYWKEKKKIESDNFRKVIEFGRHLPDVDIETRDATPDSPQQEALFDFANTQQRTFQDWQQELGEPITDIIAESWNSGEDVPRIVVDRLNYLSWQYGYNSGEDLLQQILLSMPQGVNQ